VATRPASGAGLVQMSDPQFLRAWTLSGLQPPVIGWGCGCERSHRDVLGRVNIA